MCPISRVDLCRVCISIATASDGYEESAGVMQSRSSFRLRTGQLMAIEWHADQATSGRMRKVSRENTLPEMLVRKLVHGMGYRYVLHDRRLPGRPDIVFPQRRKIIFVHGCFWHGHRCPRGALPKTNTDLWASKIARNTARDARNVRLLRAAGWSVAIVWGCSLTTNKSDALKRRLRRFLDGPRRP